MNAVDVSHLSYEYGEVTALSDIKLSVPQGTIYALLGPNGSGKTTLLQILMGLRRAVTGRISIMGKEHSTLTLLDRSRIGYIAEGQTLPGWMRLEQLEAYLAPLYPDWDVALASALRDRFGLDPRRTIKSLSRGESMKAALLCALAPRPKLLLMDEPFTGMDAMVKDELVRGLLDSASSEGWTVVLCSHDIGELEALADWVGFLGAGRMRLSEPMDVLHRRFQHVDVMLSEHDSDARMALPSAWMDVQRSGRRLTFVASNAEATFASAVLPARFPSATRIDVRDATLREVFVALSHSTSRTTHGDIA